MALPIFQKGEEDTLPATLIQVEEFCDEELRDYDVYRRFRGDKALPLEQWANSQKLSIATECAMQMNGFTRLEKYLYRCSLNPFDITMDRDEPEMWLKRRREWCLVNCKKE